MIANPHFPVEPVTQKESSRELSWTQNTDLQISALVEPSCPTGPQTHSHLYFQESSKRPLPWEGFWECPQREDFIGVAPVSLAILV